ncbi:MAG: hypothetical protein FJW14_05125 [Acidimicrobiia bacterium]|nr:hypothetical protein [Acidimicrobiia bacterium]
MAHTTTSARRTSSVREITGLRFLPDDAPGVLVNISQTGVLAETAMRCRVGGAITVAFEGGFEPATVTGRVARCEVAVMGPDGLLRYHVGVEFDSPLDVEDDQDTQEIRTAGPRPTTKKNRW